MGLRAHGPNRPSVVTRVERTPHAPRSGAKSASTAHGILLFRCTSNYVFRDTNALNHVSKQNSCYSCPAPFRRVSQTDALRPVLGDIRRNRSDEFVRMIRRDNALTNYSALPRD
jgi:hypothetical protein